MKSPNQHSTPVDENGIVVLTGGGPLPWIMINALVERFGPVTVLLEDKEPTSVMIKRRIKMLGIIETAGQVAFGVWLKFLHKSSEKRKQAIISSADLDAEKPRTCQIIEVGHVNSDRCQQALQQHIPKVVIVIGTRMIKAKTLLSTKAPFINYHAGLNPKYRGMNGGYWALATGDKENFGVTVHLIDEGVDTGNTISFARLTATQKDSFTTYPLVQAVAARELLNQAAQDALNNKLKTITIELESKQWFHPTLWGYLWTGLRRGVW